MLSDSQSAVGALDSRIALVLTLLFDHVGEPVPIRCDAEFGRVARARIQDWWRSQTTYTDANATRFAEVLNDAVPVVDVSAYLRRIEQTFQSALDQRAREAYLVKAFQICDDKSADEATRILAREAGTISAEMRREIANDNGARGFAELVAELRQTYASESAGLANAVFLLKDAGVLREPAPSQYMLPLNHKLAKDVRTEVAARRGSWATRVLHELRHHAPQMAGAVVPVAASVLPSLLGLA